MLANILIVAGVVIICVACVRKLVKDSKKGCSGCGGSCAGCGGSCKSCSGK